MAVSPGLEHTALIYDSEDDLVAVFAESVTTAIDRGQKVLVSLGASQAESVSDRIGQISTLVTFVDAGERYTKPASAMSALAAFVRDALDAGHVGAVALGEVPLATDDLDPIPWLRYEAAVNDILADLPLQAKCAYHRHLAPSNLEGAFQVHPRIEIEGGASTSPTYMTPAAFVAGLPHPRIAPEREADLKLTGIGETRSARSALIDLAQPCRRAEISLVVSELMAWFLGGPDGTADLEAWRVDGGVVVTVSGRQSPSRVDFVPDLRTPLSVGEAGLRISGELADRFAIGVAADGATAITVAFDDFSSWAKGP